MKAIILAGGKGTRLAPYTTVFPKPLMPIDGMPILEVIVRQLSTFGIEDLIFSISPYSEYLIKSFFGNGDRFKVEIDYSKEENPLGTVGSLSIIPDLPQTFLVMNGDILTTLDYKHLINYHLRKGVITTIATNKRTIQSDFGVVRFNYSYQLTEYIEKPIISHDVSMGIYVFEKEVLNWIPKNEYLDFPNLIQKLLEFNQKISCYQSNDFWLDIGRHEDYAEAQRVFPEMKGKLLYE